MAEPVNACGCDRIARAAADPLYPITFDDVAREYRLSSNGPDGTVHVMIRYCPFCGGRLTPSGRAELHNPINPAEIEEIKLQLAEVRTISQLHETLGEPAEVIEMPSVNKQCARQYLYSGRWAAVDLYVHEQRDGSLTFTFSGSRAGLT